MEPAKLRSYQEKGMFAAAGKKAFGYLMDRGLGKTATCLAEMDILVEKGEIKKILYVAPLSTLDNVRREALRFAPHLKPVVVAGDKQQRARLIAGHGNLHITNFDAVRILAMEMSSAGYDAVVVDESYKIKDSGSQVSRCVKALGLRAKVRRILTGMLFAESIEDAWNQLDFLDRSIFPQGFYPFRARYCLLEKVEIDRMVMKTDPMTGRKVPVMEAVGNPSAGPAPMIRDPYGSDLMIPDPKHGVKMRPKMKKLTFQKVVGIKNLEEFTRLIAPFVYRAEKKVCLPELPDKTYQTLRVKMTEDQAKIYSRVLKETRTELYDQVVDHKWALSKIQKLHQIASGFMYDNERVPLYLPSSKFEELTSILESSLQEAEKMVIFTAFKAEPPLIAKTIKAMSRPIEVFLLPEDGAKRQAEVDRWSAFNHCPAVFIANVASGGVGLNLQAAHMALFFSNDYKLEGRLQAEDRVHRMGSEIHNKITIIDLVTENTVDEDILTALHDKRSIVDVFLEHLRKETAE